MKKQAFSIVELIIVITILILLAIVSMTAFNKRSDEAQNSRVLADINTIKVSLVSYRAEGNEIVLPSGNRNFFSETGTYVHMDKNALLDSMKEEAYGVYGSFTEDSLPNKYLNTLPLDPRTNQYYAYGVKLSNGQFDLAGVIKDVEGGIYLARMIYSYDGVGGINTLIREYNGPNFVKDMSARLPYNPENRILVVTDENGKIYHEGDTISSGVNELEIYFADGSVSVLESNTTIRFDELSFPKENLLVSKVKVALSAGAIWTKATQLGYNSSFVITTGDISAAVRGTIFSINSDGSVNVVEGEVKVTYNNGSACDTTDTFCGIKSENGVYNLMPKFKTPDYCETPINGCGCDEEDFDICVEGNKEKIGDKMKEACEYLWKNPQKVFNSYSWDDCFSYLEVSNRSTLSFQFKGISTDGEGAEGQYKDVLFTIGDFEFKTVAFNDGGNIFNIKGATNNFIIKSLDSIEDGDNISVTFGSNDDGEQCIEKILLNGKPLLFSNFGTVISDICEYTSFSDNTMDINKNRSNEFTSSILDINRRGNN